MLTACPAIRMTPTPMSAGLRNPIAQSNALAAIVAKAASQSKRSGLPPL